MKEIFISVDLETTGRVPGEHDMYELGAVAVDDPSAAFGTELALLGGAWVPEALAACGRTIEELRAIDRPPGDAMREFARWTAAVAAGGRPVFVAMGAAFDWMFVEWYFHRYGIENPFGHAPLDIKSYYMGMTGCSWDATRGSKIDPRFKPDLPHTHRALDDAREQAEMFRRMRASR
jgi:DNA polymerase III epsilon subunit-like protein